MKPDVLVIYPTRPAQLAVLEQRYTLHRYDLADDKPGFLAEVGPRCTAVITNGHAPLDRATIEALPALKVVACSSAGFETIDVGALTERGVTLTNTSDALFDDVADTAIMLLLAVRRDLVRADAYVRSGDWGRQGMYPLQSSIRGKTLGVVGMGRIGQAIAARAEVLGMQVGYFGRTKKDLPQPYFADLAEMARWADVLMVAVAGGPDTRNLVDERVIRALGPTGTLINISRGTVVDEGALINALRDGGLGSAGLDVFLNEPTPDPALTVLPNVTLYPHHASGTEETRDAMAQLVVDNLAAHFAGEPLLTPVN